MATETTDLAAAVERLAVLTESVARQGGWLPDTELADAYERSIGPLAVPLAVPLSPAQIAIAQALVAAREQAAADAAVRQEQADRDEALAQHVNRLEEAIAAEEGVLLAELSTAQYRHEADAAAAAQVQLDELSDLRDVVIAGKLASKVQHHQALAGIGYGGSGPVFARLFEATRSQ